MRVIYRIYNPKIHTYTRKDYRMTYVITAVLVSVLTLACQKTFGNVVSEINLFFMRPFKKGDKIALRTTQNDIISGNVVRKNLTHIAIKTYTNDICIIMNSQLEKYVIINSDYRDGVNYTESIALTSDSNITTAKQLLTDIIINHPYTTNTVENTRLISKIDGDKLTIQYNVKTSDVNSSFDACSDICDEIIKAFRKHNDITLAP